MNPFQGIQSRLRRCSELPPRQCDPAQTQMRMRVIRINGQGTFVYPLRIAPSLQPQI